MNTYELQVDTISVQVIRKAMKSIRLKVTPLGQVRVSAPFGISDNEIIRMVTSRREWIFSQQKAFEQSPQSKAECATKKEQSTWKEIIEACVPLLVESWEPILGVKAKRLVYRNMKTRWGSCQPSTGRICINTRLALYPPECLEYVVVHELCHLLVANHGPEFKALLGRVMPDWKNRAKKLHY